MVKRSSVKTDHMCLYNLAVWSGFGPGQAPWQVACGGGGGGGGWACQYGRSLYNADILTQCMAGLESEPGMLNTRQMQTEVPPDR